MVNAKWTKDNIIIKQDSLLTLQVTQEGVYQLETRYKGYCTIISPPYKVTFKKMDVKLIQFEPLTICEGQMYKLYQPFSSDFYGFQGAEKFKYDLFKEGQLLKADINFLPPTTSYPFYNIDESGIYKLKVTNGKCEGISPDFILKIEKIPNGIFPNEATTFCTGKSVELMTTKNTDFNYLWQYDGQFVEKANQANFIAETDGLYRATILSQTCWKSTPSVRLKSVTNIIPTATLTGDKKIALDEEAKLSINLTSHAPWTFKLSDGKEYTATKSPFEVSVKPLSTTTYSVTEVNNICGTGTVSGSAKIEIIILSAEEEKELKVEVFPMPSSEICHWKIETPQATNASVQMYDALGVTQYSQASTTRTQTHEGTIDLTNMKSGTYFLKLQAGEKSVTRKVVKF